MAIEGIIRGKAQEIMHWVSCAAPEAEDAMTRVASRVPFIKRQIAPYQGWALYLIARALEPRRILEIGTAIGYSAAVLAEAAPRAEIITLNPKPWEVEAARRNLAHYPNVMVVQDYSWNLFDKLSGEWDMIWVDGDHRQVRRDFPWFNRLRVGGLMLFHDYSPDGSWRPCAVVYDALNDLAAYLGRYFDVLVIDDGLVGMAGFYRREGETYGESIRDS